jgi:multidrug efflux pump subunit AcrA (membrane-fusion protein)
VKGIGVEVARTSTVQHFYEAAGTVRSKITSVLSSRVTGNILIFHVREGDPVKAGQVLLEIDDRNLHTQLEKAQAGLHEAQDLVEEIERNIQSAKSAKTALEAEQILSLATYKRYKTLLEKKSVSQQEFDQVEARYRARMAGVERANAQIKSLFSRKEQGQAKIEQAKAEVSTAQIFIGYARIQSPIDGIVVGKHADVGALAIPGTPLLTIEDSSHYRLEAAVEESMVGRIRIKDSVSVRIDAYGSMEWNGSVSEISPASDPGSRSVMVKIDLTPKDIKTSPRPFLRSGFFGKVRFPSGERTLIALPAKAVFFRGQLQGVYIVDSTNVARWRLIQAGKTYGDRVEILSGIRDGERVVVEGLEKVQDGYRIEG